jgi:hypothetical protein
MNTLRHYLMTRAYRGPDYPPDANARRIELCRRITVRSLASQDGDWTWLVYVHPDDPLREERLDAFREAGRPVVPIVNNGEAEAAIDWHGPVLTTRIDDDDAFSGDAFGRLYATVRLHTALTAYIFPVGYHVRDGRAELNRHLRNAWSSLYSPAGFREHIRLYQHQRVPGAYPVVYLDERPAWLRVSHPDNERPTSHRPSRPVTAEVRAMFDVDWDALSPRVAA